MGREGTREGEREGESKGREVGSDDARRAENVSGGRGVEGGRVDEGNERGRDGTRHRQREGGIERRRDWARNGGGAREQVRETSREVS